MVLITSESLDVPGIFQAVQSAECGATVLFTGSTRRLTEGRETIDLSYECYREMAAKVLANLESQARERWEIAGCHIQHRVGLVPVGEISVVVAVSSAHRDAAFEAARWLIDSLKETVPIWKQEHWSDGSREWIHPRKTPENRFGVDSNPVGS